MYIFYSQPFNGEIQEIDEDHKITDIHDEDFDSFLRDEKSVKILVNCFLNLKACPHKSIQNLLCKYCKLWYYFNQYIYLQTVHSNNVFFLFSQYKYELWALEQSVRRVPPKNRKISTTNYIDLSSFSKINTEVTGGKFYPISDSSSVPRSNKYYVSNS